MKKLTVSIFTLFFVLFGSVFTASAEETTNFRSGEIKAKVNTYIYPTNEYTEIVQTLVKGISYPVYEVNDETYTLGGAQYVFKKDGTYTKLTVPDGDRIGVFIPNANVYTYKVPKDIKVPSSTFAKDKVTVIYNYENGMFGVGGGWIPAKDVTFTQYTNDKETPVTTTTIGRVASIDGDVPIYSTASSTATTVGTLKQDDFATTLEVKGKVNGYYNVGTNKWIAENPDKVRFFPPNTETDMYKFVYDARKWEGTKYTNAGIFVNNGGFDELGFIYRNFKDAGYGVGRVSVDAYELLSKKVTKPHIGDLIFFKVGTNGKRSVGIIVSEKAGKLKYVSSTSPNGVQVNSFKTTDTNISGYGRLR